MFGSTVLEIALGLTLTYLALSLLCSALNEFYSTLMSRRQAHLKDAIFSLIDPDDPRGRRFLAMFFTHPMIKALVPPSRSGKPQEAPGGTARAQSDWSALAIEDGLKSLKATPRYIPDRTFADVVFDILTHWTTAPAEAADPAFAMTPGQVVDGLIKDLQESTAQVPLEVVQKGLRTEVDEDAQRLHAAVAGGATAQATWEAVGRTIDSLRRTTRSINDPRTQAVLNAVLDRWDGRLRAVRDDRASVDRVREAASAALTALRGASSVLPDNLAKARYLGVLDELATRLVAPELASASSEAVRQAVRESLASLEGIASMIGNTETRDGLLELIRRQAESLAQSGSGLVTLRGIRAAVEDLPESQIKTTLRTLMNEQGEDLEKVRQNTERWFNDTMDRVSVWYKRNTQIVIFVIALGLSFSMNADTLVIGNRLAQDPALRMLAATAARDVIGGTPGDASRTGPGGATSGPGAATGRPTTVGGSQPPPDGSPAGSQPRQFTEEERRRIEGALDQLRLPIGWDRREVDRLVASFGLGREAGWTDAMSKLAGLLITTLALTMGAPFWYDVLSKFVSIQVGGERPERGR
ncbi:MAG: hypothetical protein U0790_12165 [Isosphaeraceae bacterium]